jgi:hypothetical protein
MVPETVTPLEGEQSERRTNRVLIAEDDPMFRKILTRTMLPSC